MVGSDCSSGSDCSKWAFDPGAARIAQNIRSEKWQNESSPNFSNFCPEFPPEFCSEFSPKILRNFRASFPRKRRPEKIHQKSPPFFNAKFPGEYEKKYSQNVSGEQAK